MAAPGVSGASGGGTLYVAHNGTDTGTCRLSSSPCATIAYAISVANPSSVIDVGSGTYAQQLVVSMPLTIQATSGPVVINPASLPVLDTNPDRGVQEAAVIDVTAGPTKLKNLTIDGSAAQDTFNSCAIGFEGVYYHNASGTMTGDTVQNIQLPPTDFGCQTGNGVLVRSETGDSASVSIGTTTVSAYQKKSVRWDSGTSCTVTGSTITGTGPNGVIAANGIEGVYASRLVVSTSTVTANSYTGGGCSGTRQRVPLSTTSERWASRATPTRGATTTSIWATTVRARLRRRGP